MKSANLHLTVIWLFAILSAAWLAKLYFESPDPLWADLIHDRNAHLQSGMAFAVDLPRGNVISIIRQLDRSQTWPPLHDTVLVGISLLLTGLNEKGAIFPSLIGYILTIVFAYLLVKKVLGHRAEIGGYFAAFLVGISPAMRAFAVDVMLESLGAALTLMAFYYYLRLIESPNYQSGRILAWVMSALFFLKYNYWLLVLFAFVAHTIWFFRSFFWAWLREKYERKVIQNLIRQQLWHPVTFLLVFMFTVLMVIHYTKGFTIPLGKNGIVIKSGTNLVTAIWWVFTLRIGIWYWKKGDSQIQVLSPVISSLVRWQVIPAFVWFLWPRRLYYFIWFSNPTANAGERPDFDPLGGYQFYFTYYQNDYLAQNWYSWLSIVFLGLGLLIILIQSFGHQSNYVHTGALVLFVFLVICVVLTCQHPNRKSRFLHSWIPMVWVIGGIGLAGMAKIPVRKIPLGLGITTVGMGGIVALGLNDLQKIPKAQEARSYETNDTGLVLSRAYLPLLEGEKQVALFSNLPIKFFTAWTHHQYWQRQMVIETEIKGWFPGLENDFEPFQSWVNNTLSTKIVYLEIGEKSPMYREIVSPYKLDRYGSYLQKQSRFRLAQQMDFPELDCRIWVYQIPAE